MHPVFPLLAAVAEIVPVHEGGLCAGVGWVQMTPGEQVSVERNGLQNHFFGPVFKGTPDDRAFFERIDFSARGQALCAKPH